MLNIKDIDDFATLLRSGQLESDFLNAPESRRLEILELLEKIMDLAELCDETATRIIFRTPFPQGEASPENNS